MTTPTTHSDNFNYAPLNETASYVPPTPPPLYPTSETRTGSHSPPRGNYRPESMHYSKPVQAAGAPTSLSEGASVALLSQSERDSEKAYISGSHDDDGSGSRSSSPSSYKKSHIRGKRWLSFFRIVFAFITILLSIVSVALISIALFSIYSPSKDVYKTPTTATKDQKASAGSNSDRIYAFPQTINQLPNYLIFGASLFAIFASITVVSAPCWRSNKKFHRTRFAKTEICEIIFNVIVVAVGAAAIYFAFSTKPNQETSLWGYSCSISSALNSTANATASGASVLAKKYPQVALFPEINYQNACSDYEASVYTLLLVVIFTALGLATYLVNFCLKKGKGEYKHDDTKTFMNACDCCAICTPTPCDCAACFDCLCCCFS
ncbi:hypothetical protein ABW20_dc0103269 [Dactylellina cionopaga]|nr:hypothetical protein ABW20_dc0103269 [Dactylellina cionopaga]